MLITYFTWACLYCLIGAIIALIINIFIFRYKYNHDRVFKKDYLKHQDVDICVGLICW
jgi:uncharacterized membrane protein YgaE (UPF0421/DUF939 family)